MEAERRAATADPGYKKPAHSQCEPDGSRLPT